MHEHCCAYTRAEKCFLARTPPVLIQYQDDIRIKYVKSNNVLSTIQSSITLSFNCEKWRNSTSHSQKQQKPRNFLFPPTANSPKLTARWTRTKSGHSPGEHTTHQLQTHGTHCRKKPESEGKPEGKISLGFRKNSPPARERESNPRDNSYPQSHLSLKKKK